MKQKLNLSVLLPIKSAVTKDFTEYFDKAMTSLKSQTIEFTDLIIVHTNEETLVNHLKNYDFGKLKVKLVEWNEEPNYSNQMNRAIQESKSEWVSFFEFDDEYANIWFKNVKKYVDSYPDVGSFLPIVVDINDKGTFAGFTNEATFAANFSNEIGVLSNETLLNYQNFQTSGMVVKKQVLTDFGGFKPSIKLTFGYELFLRLTYNNIKIMTIPRIGYKHLNLREGSIFWNYKNGSTPLTENEVKFWIESAKKEYFFNKDRNIKYEPTEN